MIYTAQEYSLLSDLIKKNIKTKLDLLKNEETWFNKPYDEQYPYHTDGLKARVRREVVEEIESCIAIQEKLRIDGEERWKEEQRRVEAQ